jgi:DNA-binding winged helix-turn-helix (wHTH) protein/TolB-like protein
MIAPLYHFEMRERIRFGIFDFDPDSRELRREGAPVRLQAQPAQLLAALVARAGEVVTREELRQRVWGEDTFVDFDRGLNYCIAQIRTALGDSAESPRYIRTIPKRGYQFLGPVGQTAPVPVGRPARHSWKARVAVAALCVLGLAAAVLFLARGQTVNIAVARFDNETGESDLTAFADSLTDSVVAELTAAGGSRYRIIGNAVQLRRPRAERNLAAIGSELHASYVILGQVRRGRVLAHLIRLPEQTHVAVVREDGAVPAESELARRIAGEFLGKLGASPAPPTR